MGIFQNYPSGNSTSASVSQWGPDKSPNKAADKLDSNSHNIKQNLEHSGTESWGIPGCTDGWRPLDSVSQGLKNFRETAHFLS